MRVYMRNFHAKTLQVDELVPQYEQNSFSGVTHTALCAVSFPDKRDYFISIKVEIRFRSVDQKNITCFDINTTEQFQRNPILNSTAFKGLESFRRFGSSECFLLFEVLS